MGNTPSRSSRIDGLSTGPLAPHVDAFKQYLTDRGYAKTTFANYVGGVALFAQWMQGRRLPVRHLDEAAITEFLEEHLPRCLGTGAVQGDRRNLSAALGHLLAVLRAEGAVAPPTLRTTPVGEELRRYDAYMDHVRGLATKTQSMALRIVRRLLASRFGECAIDIATIQPHHVRQFFAQQAKLYSKPANAGAVVAALRGYLRYCDLVRATRQTDLLTPRGVAPLVEGGRDASAGRARSRKRTHRRKPADATWLRHGRGMIGLQAAGAASDAPAAGIRA
jgi:hypothetical protein